MSRRKPNEPAPINALCALEVMRIAENRNSPQPALNERNRSLPRAAARNPRPARGAGGHEVRPYEENGVRGAESTPPTNRDARGRHVRAQQAAPLRKRSRKPQTIRAHAEGPRGQPPPPCPFFDGLQKSTYCILHFCAILFVSIPMHLFAPIPHRGMQRGAARAEPLPYDGNGARRCAGGAGDS